MSVLTLKRIFLVAALLLVAPALFAGNPSALTGARMVYNEQTGFTILFGGVTAFDSGASAYFNPTETWLWNGLRWMELYPSQKPAGRASHVMVWDSTRSRIVLFGGRQGGGNTATDLGDTWTFANGEWNQITTSDAPSIRAFAGAAYDRGRDRIVLFGGNNTVPPPPQSTTTPTVTNYYDTWEFDGTNWTKVADNGPQVIDPILVFDEATNQILMVAQDSNYSPLMFSYDPNAHTWAAITPQTMPPCTNQAAAVFERASGTVFLTGGVCVTKTLTSPSTEEVYSWDGTNWSKLGTGSSITKTTEPALAYDAQRNVVIIYGGTEAYAAPHAYTYTFDPSLADSTANTGGDWVSHDPNMLTPGPRSLAAFKTDPTNQVVYLVNGLTDGTSNTDFWIYQNGGWTKITAGSTPSCGTPFAAVDTDRSKLVVVCNDGSTSEWDNAAGTWTAFTGLKTTPKFTKFASMIYDPTMKRTVLYGGYDDTNYVDSTWEWDGTTWTQMKKHSAPARSLTSMWYDPIQKRTVLFGGIGRPSSTDAVERYDDMWWLDPNNGWTQLKPTTVPNTRYGAQIAVDPRNGHAILFGGLRLDIDSKGLQHQVYANDMWEWDGTNWTQIQTTNTPPPRENGAFEFDYGRNQFVLFGGYAGYFLSDVWLLDGNTWQVVPESMKRGRVVSPKH